jgi:hypothetical protein
LPHTAPRGLGPQLPETHWTLLTQSEADAQVEMHLLVAGSHPNGAQMIAGPGLQRPWPSQMLTSLTESPRQVPGLQTVPETYLRQWPAPSQLPSRPHADTSDLAQVDGVRGASPDGTNVHTPGALPTLQDMHVSLQSLLQQTPSTQKPLTQSAAHMHACPLLLRVPFVFEHFGPPPPPPPQPITAAAQAMKSHSLLTRRTYPARN